ncbi:MAG TPA: hypothetical protein VL728_03400 [Cyclobacteriaceae bacterium]|jgi:hypothetical protein|nr:hypothetical protein [Cyclobacteriaceae bacterium]
MKNYIWTLPLVLVLMLGMPSLSPRTATDDSFKEFLKKLRLYGNAYHLGDTLTSSTDLYNKNQIESMYLIKFKLIDTTGKAPFKPKELTGYGCKFIGLYPYKNVWLILTYSITTYAGDGSPLLTLSVFTNDGMLLDQLKTEVYSIHDPEYQPETRFSMSKDFRVEVDQIVREFRLNQNKTKYVLTGTTAKIKKYRIKDDGSFEAIVKAK